MQYTEGKTGRVFLLKIEDGEDLIQTISDFISAHRVMNGYIRFIGALRSGQIVTGPEKMVLPPEPHFEMFSDGWEVIGMATITTDQERDEPHLHIHAAIGKGKNVFTGCLRGQVKTYIVIEAVITELTGVVVKRMPDKKTGMILPEFGNE